MRRTHPIAMNPVAVTFAILIAVAGCGKTDSEHLSAREPGTPATSNTGGRDAGGDPAIMQVGGGGAGREPAALPTGSDLELKPLAAGESDVARSAFDRLVRAHRDEDAESWISADQELTKLARAAAPTLARGLKSEDRNTRELAAMMLAKIGPDAEPVADAIHAALQDDSPLVRANAAAILSLLAKHPDEVRAVLVALLDEGSPNVRMMAVYSVGNLGRSAGPLLPRLTALLSDESAEIRQAAATALGNLGTIATPTLKTLDTLADDTSEAVRLAAAEAKRRIAAASEIPSDGPSRVVPDEAGGEDAAVAEQPASRPAVSRPIGKPDDASTNETKPTGPKLSGPSFAPPGGK